MSSCVENSEVDDCSWMMSIEISDSTSNCAFSDASTLVRSCFSHSVGAIRHLVGRSRTDIDATVSCPPLLL